VFIEAMQRSGLLAGVASEEMDNHYPIPNQYPRGNYLLTFDPLDGSSNIDVNGATGTIFSITRHDSPGAPNDEDFLKPGNQQICAGYCHSSIGEFVLTHPDMRIPEATSEFAINAAYRRHWFAPVTRYIDECSAGKSGPRERDFNMRWAGSMVGDIHRILCRGGLFLYPEDAKLAASGKAGKLRLLYEANPMGMLVEQAGGMASTGRERIMDIEPSSLHQRVPVVMGSSEEVQRLIDYHISSS